MEAYAEENTGVRNQYIAATIINILAFSHGCAIGWVSPSLAVLGGAASPLGAPLSGAQASLVASLVCAGGLAGTPLFGWLADNYGRKMAALATAVPYLVSWATKLSWTTPHGLMVARFVAGLGGAGAFLLPPLYAIEVASPASRGALGSLMVFAINLGIVFTYALGSNVSYATTLGVMIAFPIVFFFLMIRMPETPTYLVKKNKDEEAIKAIAWLRDIPVSDPIVKRVLANLKYEAELANSLSNQTPIKEFRVDHNHFFPLVLGVDGKPPVKKVDIEEIPAWKLILTSKPTRRAFTVVFLLLSTQCFMGLFAIITYASEIFAQAGSQMSPATSSIVVASLQFIGSIFASSLIERLGRKVLLISSCAVVSLSMAILGTFFYAQNSGYDVSDIGWIPVTALSSAVATFAVGIGPVPYVLPSEIIMVQARSMSMSLLCMWVWIASFLIAQFYGAALEIVGIYGVFWGFSLVGIAGIVITIFLFPETKGKPLDELIAYFSGDKSRAVQKRKDEENGELL